MAGYRIDGVLGRGGMGVVYRATQLSLGREVALKLLAVELSEDPGFRARFQREAKLQAALEHEHIVPVYEAGQTDDGLFMAMRLIDGPTLKDLILENQLDPRRSLRILAQVAQALDAAHDAGLIHRDIKPQNILIEQARPRLPGRLRTDQGSGRSRPDRHRAVHRDDRLRLPRADPRRAGDGSQRHLRPVRRPVRMPDRPGSVPPGERGRGDPRARRPAPAPRNRATSRPTAGDRRGGREPGWPRIPRRAPRRRSR